MTLVNTETGEVVEFDRSAAERRAERIRLRLDTIADNLTAVLPMIREAIAQRDDVALGYRSPGEYVADRFGASLSGLGIEVRRAVVGELTEAGLSTRAIAPVVGVGKSTVDRDLSHVGHLTSPEGESAPEAVHLGSEQRTATGAATPAASRPPVTGIDGKTYTKKPQRRVPRPVAERTLAVIQSSAAKAAREAQTLTPDQIRRVRAEAGHVTASLRTSIEALQRLVDSLNPEETK